MLALAVTTAARAQFSGSGTQADPYLVSTAADLTTLATKVNNGTGYSGEYFKQTADINMSGIAWAAIGTNQNPFYGNYDGNHKTISNLTCSASSGSFGGLFGKVGNQNNTESRTLKNIRLVNCTISSSSNAAGIVATSTNCNIECCEVMGSISGSSSVGGIAGEMTGGSIEGCFASGTVSASGYSSSKGMILGSTTSAPTCSGNTYISTNSVGAGTSSVANLGTAQPTSGTLSSKISWTLGGTYHTELTITATNNTGGMPWDYSTTTIAGIARTTAPWGWHFSELTVDDGVTIIKNNAFAGNPNLNTVTLPASVYIIGSNAFAGNHNLEIVTLPASGFNIGSGAFADCISLQRVIIQYLSAVPLGANNVFDGCTALQYIDFPNLSAALANTTGNWSGYADKVRALFCGQYFHVTTNGDTYAISTEEDLRNLAAVVNGGNDCEGETFRQTADIDLSSGGDFPMIGKYIGTYFKGTYDGGNRTISGLVVNNNSIKNTGLFCTVEYGTVRNVILVSPNVRCTYNTGSDNNVGSLIGTANHATVQNCHAVDPTVNSSASGAGALVGYVDNSSSITNCYFHGGNQDKAVPNYHTSSNSTLTNVSRAYAITLGDGVTTTTPATNAANGFVCSGVHYYRHGLSLALGSETPLGAGYSNNNFTIDGSLVNNPLTVAGSHDGKTIHLGTPTPNPVHFEQNGDVYFIHSADGWDVFCDALQDNTTYNRFSGKTVKLAPSSGNSISVTRMAGSSQHDFCGTFDGQGKTLDFNYTTSTDDAAPFRYVDGGRIENLRVTGTITTSAKNAAGIIAHQYGSTTISNCRSNVTISSSISGDGTHGGLVAVTGGGSTVSFEGCVFDGSLLGTSTRCWGGFVGWRSSSNGTVNVSNSIFNPASVTGNADDSYTFVRRGDNTKVNITNSYYTTALGLLGLNVELTNYNAQGQEIWQEDISFGDDW